MNRHANTITDLQEIEFHSSFALILSNSKEFHQVVMTNIWSISVPVHVYTPFTVEKNEVWLNMIIPCITLPQHIILFRILELN